MTHNLRRIARLTTLYVLEAIAALLALAVVVFGAALWRLAEGPVNADMVRPMVIEALLNTVGGDTAEIGDLSLSFDPELAALVITAREVQVSDSEGDVLVASDQVEAALALDLLLVGRPAPVRLSATGGAVWLARNHNGELSGGLGSLSTGFSSAMPANPAGDRPDLDAATSLMGRLLFVDLSNVRLYVRDEGADWTGIFDNTAAQLDLSGRSLSLHVDGQLLTFSGAVPVQADIQAGRDLGRVFADIRIEGLVPASIAPGQGLMTAMTALDAPFDAHLVFDADQEDGLRAASLEVVGGEGRVQAQDRTVPLQAARVDVSLDVESGVLEVRQLRLASELISFDVSGRVSNFSGFDSALPSRADYALTLSEGGLDLGGFFPEAIQWLGGRLEGQVDVQARLLELDALELEIPGAALSLSGALSVQETEVGWLPNVRLQGPVDGVLSKADVLRHWPVDFALGARDWVRDSILEGELFDAQLSMDLRAEELAGRLISDDALSLSFNFRNADVRYMSTMTPLMGLDGQAELRGNSLSLEGSGGVIGEIVADRIFVDIPQLNPKGFPARFGGQGRGSAAAFLQLVNEPPLSLAETYGFDPEAFEGEGEIEFEISRPMLRSVPAEDLGYSVTGAFSNVAGPAGPPGLDLANGELTLEVTTQGMQAVGQADIGASRADIVWTETFGLPEDQPSSQIDVRAMMSARDLDAVGLPLRRFMDGVIGVQAGIEGRGFDFSAVDVSLDLADAAIVMPADLWEKPAGEAAQAHMRVALNTTGALVLETLRLDGEGVSLETSAQLAADGRLLAAEASRAYVEGRMDLSAQIDRPEGEAGPLRVVVEGPYLDAQDLFGMAAPSDGGAMSAAIDFDGALDRVLVRDQVFTDVGLALSLRPEGVARFSLEADGATGPLIVRFEPEAETGERRLSALGPDAGILLAAFAGFDNIAGGAVQLSGVAPPLGQPGGVVGQIELDAFTLERMPLLARILAAGSLEGLGGLLSGQGIGFERFQTEFVWQDGVLEMRDSRVAGASLGATWTGLVDFDEARLDVDGTLLPSYGMNSILGSVPLVGELLTSRRGEGVIGVTFSVSGPFSGTRVTANPLSALAPGVFRRIFEGTSADRELAALEEARRQQEQDMAPEPAETDATGPEGASEAEDSQP